MVESRTVAHLACKVEAPQVRVGQFEGLGDSSESKAKGSGWKWLEADRIRGAFNLESQRPKNH